jgi:hypothetical protein
MKQMTEILSGSFTSGEGKLGNFTAYNANGEKIFIHKRTMESLKWLTNADVKFPFYAITDDKEINTRDKDGQLTEVKATRLQALSVFETEDAMTDAFTSSERLAIKAKAKVQSVAKASGLNDAAIDALLSVAVTP